jgi:hypothetical protein
MNKTHRVFLGLTVLTLLLVFTSAALAGGGYDASWSVIGGGGGTTQMGVFRIEGSIGQAVTGPASEGIYNLNAGFWTGVESVFKSFLPVINR